MSIYAVFVVIPSETCALSRYVLTDQLVWFTAHFVDVIRMVSCPCDLLSSINHEYKPKLTSCFATRYVFRNHFPRTTHLHNQLLFEGSLQWVDSFADKGNRPKNLDPKIYALGFKMAATFMSRLD